jgi:hypothetical protein
MPRIFISYRREDSAGHVGRLKDRLSSRFDGDGDKVFMDIDTIKPGVDFSEAIKQAVGSCDVFLAVIGKHWLSSINAQGARRLDNPEDYVRQEITAALTKNILVIPVLVQGASMPNAQDLPDDLKILTHRNAVELSDQRWDYDTRCLIEALHPRSKLWNLRKQRRKLLMAAVISMILFVSVLTTPGVFPHLRHFPSAILLVNDAPQQDRTSFPFNTWDAKRLADSLIRIASTLIADLNSRGKQGYESWVTAQTTSALIDLVEIDPAQRASIISFFVRDQMDHECYCWREIPRPASAKTARHIPNSAWVLYAMALLNEPITYDQLKFLLDTQHAEGWWPVFPSGDHFQENASTYATNWALLALHEYESRKLIEGQWQNTIREAIERGRGWLLSNRIPDAIRWKDYPLSAGNSYSPPGKESIGLSALTLYVLHKINDAEHPISLEDFDQMWLASLPDRIPKSTETEQADRHVNSLDGRVADHIRYLKLPWMIIANAEAYPNGTFFQKVSTIMWVQRALDESGLLGGEMGGIQNWNRAELLISLKRLAGKRI